MDPGSTINRITFDRRVRVLCRIFGHDDASDLLTTKSKSPVRIAEARKSERPVDSNRWVSAFGRFSSSRHLALILDSTIAFQACAHENLVGEYTVKLSSVEKYSSKVRLPAARPSTRTLEVRYQQTIGLSEMVIRSSPPGRLIPHYVGFQCRMMKGTNPAF
jgi:hypothetical protein